ncbi:Leucine-, isoleucine-, valine-, threonine-, and alanine-binding protein precursor [Nonomuraea coxensis DSM 45129]|uniref:Leucine-, isoleucine-, valine-, threonine-, and alanine-binding protein n=1 Tax=Nonomuraea coxensis DSM 45129 TaxID=1122611 RepID=A0ABX8U4S6_9ACTN|nr:ABC transporter substrate-binding protein [Nonomuraea coxensis]QYC41744.1 Leucine-, isoleucine-, valine-, threonine-, and alanine-binding protein precursor [Nonomuraea coxensis DSM 45129]
MSDASPGGMNRRSFLSAAGLGAAAIGGAPLLSACGGLKGTGASSSSDVLKIGYVSPQTGALAGFASADNFVVKQITEALRGGFTAGGRKRTVEIIVKDTQSNPNRATEVTRQLINSDKVDLIVGSSTPDTTNPVADQCEANGIPNVTTIAPWEAWWNGRGGKDGEGFTYTTLFFFGMQEFADCFFPMWERMEVGNKNVAALWPNDTDANAFRQGLGPMITKAGYEVVDGGAYQNGVTDFSSQIAKFKSSEAELFTCTPIPPDFQTFWKQARQQGFKPKLATVAKVMLFPSEAEALGPLASNIATDFWWSPAHPYKSTLDGKTAQQLAEDFAATGKQWTQALGSVYSLFEIAVQAFKNAGDPKDRDDVADKLRTMKISCMSGDLDFTAGPKPGIALQHPVGGQWRKGTKFPWDVAIVDNTPNKAVPIGGDLLPTGT